MARVSITKNDVQIALKVLAQTRYIQDWAISEVKFLGINPLSPQGMDLVERKAREHAAKHLEFPHGFRIL